MKKTIFLRNTKTLVLTLALVSISINTYAQQGRGNRRQHVTPEEIESHKIAFFTSHIGLTPEESALFWAQYNVYSKERKIIFDEKNTLIKQARESNVNNDADKLLLLITKEIELQTKYLNIFKKILPSKKFILYVDAEDSFKRYILRRLRTQQNNNTEN